jgi:hypothetical protein
LGVTALPLIAFAQAPQGPNLNAIKPYSDALITLINGILVPILIAIAFIVFLWGVYKYFILGADDEAARQTGRQFVLWGIIGLVVIFTVWALVALVMGTLGLGVAKSPPYPTIGGSGQTSTGGGGSGGLPVGGGTPGGKVGSPVYNSTGTQMGTVSTDGRSIVNSRGQTVGYVGSDGRAYTVEGNPTNWSVQSGGGSGSGGGANACSSGGGTCRSGGCYGDEIATASSAQDAACGSSQICCVMESKPVGGSCEYASQCESGYCDQSSGTCQAGDGDACAAASDPDACRCEATPGNVWSFGTCESTGGSGSSSCSSPSDSESCCTAAGRSWDQGVCYSNDSY